MLRFRGVTKPVLLFIISRWSVPFDCASYALFFMFLQHFCVFLCSCNIIMFFLCAMQHCRTDWWVGVSSWKQLVLVCSYKNLFEQVWGRCNLEPGLNRRWQIFCLWNWQFQRSNPSGSYICLLFVVFLIDHFTNQCSLFLSSFWLHWGGCVC